MAAGNAPAPTPEPQHQTQPQVLPKPSPNLVELITVIAEKAEPIIKVFQATMESYQKGKERDVKLQTRMALIALGTVLAIVGTAGFLTYHGKIDGSTFTFLLGLIVGYVLTFVRDQITGPGE